MFSFENALLEFYRDVGPDGEIAKAFLSDDCTISRFVLGRNEHALACMNCRHVDGVVDDFAPAGSVWNGVPVISASSLPSGAVVVNCSMSIRPLSAHARVAAVGGVNVLAYADLMRISRQVPLPTFVAEFRTDYRAHEAKWRHLAAVLGDAASLTTLDALMRFRLTADYRFMKSFSVRIKEQYFDSVAPLSNSEVFVDCGGYDGDTVLEFCSRVNGYKRIYMFEPSPINFEKAGLRLAEVPNVELMQLGVSNESGILSFDGDAGSASAVTSSGPNVIRVVAIDEQISEQVTYLKMDLEGWELRALSGARRHLIDDHPRLAVAVYHKASDFWQIPEYILGLRTDYDIFVRHYTEGWSETVMYFVPRKK